MTQSNEPLLSASRITCGYDRYVVLREVDFSIEKGSITALIGPNGAGKSTLLKTLCGVIPLISGSIRFRNQDWNQLDERDIARSIAYVPQEEEPKFGFTSRQLVQMGRLAHSNGIFETDSDRKMVESALELADAIPFAERSVAELSGGERQRVLVARALAQEPALLLLDEPTAHLDFAHQLSLKAMLKKRAMDGMAIIVALHDLNQAARLAERILVLNQGQIVLEGETQAVLSSPALETVYGVGFQHWRDPQDRLWIVPNET